MPAINGPKNRASIRIGVEAISAGSGFRPGAGGMASYYEGVLAGLAERDDVSQVVVFVSPWNNGLAIPDHPKMNQVVCHGLPRNRPGRVAYEQVILPMLARRARIDALVCTTNVMPLLRRAPTVVVLQSIQYFLWPDDTGAIRRAYLRAATGPSLRRAGAVITVSETQRQDALRIFKDVQADRFFSVHHGASGWTSELDVISEPFRLSDGCPYILCISRLYEHKNHRRVIEAFASIAGEVDHSLVIVGGDADVTADELRAQAESLQIGDRVHLLGLVEQSRIPGLFAGATAVAYPSLYETFGHPVLEAFASGRPLITSAAGATAEIAGNAAYLVEPESTASIAEGLRVVLADPARQQRMSAAGLERLREFSWRRSAAGHRHAIAHAMHA